MSSNLAVMLPLAGLAAAGLFLLAKQQKKPKRVAFGAFIERLELLPPPPPPPPAAPLPLTGLTFGVKDILDVKGTVTGFGHPQWRSTHEPAPASAPVVKDLVDAGAKCVGKTHMDEVAYSINGENMHYGTPENPAAPQHVPGGSSGGSAVVVAGDLVDFAVGTDTAGSVRIPAAYTGVIGFRPSHGSVSAVGCVPMSPSLDTVGWFARDAEVLRSVGHVMLQQPYTTMRAPQRLLIADDLFVLSTAPSKPIIQAVAATAEKLIGRTLEHVKVGNHLAAKVPSLQAFRPQNDGAKGEAAAVDEDPGRSALIALRDAMRALQGYEFKSCHGAWVESAKPTFSPDIGGRVKAAMNSSPEQAQLALKVREEARAAMNSLLQDDAVLVLPTAPGFPPKLRTRAADLDDFRSRAFLLLCIASMSGCPQVSVPAGTLEGPKGGLPLAISFMARHGADRFLMDVVAHFAPSIALKATEQIAASAQPGTAAKLASPAARQGGKPSAAEVAKERGNEAFKAKNYAKAVTHYSHAIELDGNSAAYFNNRAIAYINMHKFEEAEADCSSALDLDKKNVKAMLRRGTAREFLGFYGDALEDFSQALVYEPTNKTAIDAIERLQSSGVLGGA